MLHFFAALTMPVAVSFPCDKTNHVLNLDHAYSLEREEAEDLIKRHGGRVTGSVSKKTVLYFSILLFLGFMWQCWYLINTMSVCRVIFYVMRILRDGNLQKPKNLGRLPQIHTCIYIQVCYCLYFIITISSCSTPFLTEDGLFDKILSSKNSKAPAREDSKVSVEKVASLPRKSPQKADLKSMLPVSLCL